MYYLDFKDYVRIVLKSLLASLIIVPIFLEICFLIKTNIDFSYFVCDSCDIPRDLAISVMSMGFANNMIFLLSVFEFGVIYYLFNKIKNSKLYTIVWEFMTNLWNSVILWQIYEIGYKYHIYVVQLFT